MPDTTLLLLIDEVRNKTLKLLDGVSEDLARFAPAGLSNSILWHAGHAFVVNEHLGIAAATGKPPELPEGWFETFSWKSQPATVTRWPATSEVISRLRDQQQRLRAAVGAMTIEQLDKVVDPARDRSVRYTVLHGLHDEANHQGEMWLLKKLHGKRLAAATSSGS